MDKTGNTKFIRVHGRIVPIHGKGSAPPGASKRYGVKKQVPKVKHGNIFNSAVNGAIIGQTVALGAAIATKRPVLDYFGRGLATGGLIGAAVGSIKHTNKGKGESNHQTAMRVAGKFKKGK